MNGLLEGGVGGHVLQEEPVELQSCHKLPTRFRLNTSHVICTQLPAVKKWSCSFSQLLYSYSVLCQHSNCLSSGYTICYALPHMSSLHMHVLETSGGLGTHEYSLKSFVPMTETSRLVRSMISFSSALASNSTARPQQSIEK